MAMSFENVLQLEKVVHKSSVGVALAERVYSITATQCVNSNPEAVETLVQEWPRVPPRDKEPKDEKVYQPQQKDEKNGRAREHIVRAHGEPMHRVAVLAWLPGKWYGSSDG